MSVDVTEGAIVLNIDSERCVKWDEHPAFLQGIGRLQRTRAVDVCASVAGDGAVFIEMKDFRAAATDNGPRITSGALAQEVAEKVRDSLAGLIWACDRGLGEPFHERLVREYLERPKALVVLWLEQDTVDVGGATALQDTIRSALKPHIEAKVIVTSSLLEKKSRSPLPWVRARGLAAPRLAKR